MTLRKIKKQLFVQQSGFSLIEIAIVLVIFGLLLTMFLTPLSTQRNLQNRAETNALLHTAKEALFGYAIVNGHFPCPDTKPVPTGEADATCTTEGGVLPWNTLGISPTDAWNHYFTYYVDATFSNSINNFTINAAEGNSNISIRLIPDISNTALTSVNSNPALVVVSHGENGFGAINTNPNSTLNKEPASSNAHEIENDGTNGIFVSHPPTADGFDDQLIWISPKVLINRMIMAERLP